MRGFVLSYLPNGSNFSILKLMKISEDQYLAAVYAFDSFGPARTKLLLNFFKASKNIWNATETDLLRVNLKKDLVERFIEHRRNFDIEEYFLKLKKLKIGFATFLNKNYPENLKGLDDAPCVLYYRGILNPKEVNLVAIVGARKMTSYGREVTEKFAGELAGFGATIVSGLARGVDTVAHKEAIAAGGRTIAVLGNGLDITYPPENEILAKEIVKSGGAVISEYPLGYPALPVNFANRNRIISGLSKAIIVIEGAEKSGTLLTATHAAEQGRTVFAIPGAITSPMSAAPLFLLKNGARIAITPGDILDELDLQIKVDREKVEKILPTGRDEEKLLEILATEPMHLDELVRITGSKTSEISARLMILEMKGLVRNLGNGVYKKSG